MSDFGVTETVNVWVPFVRFVSTDVPFSVTSVVKFSVASVPPRNTFTVLLISSAVEQEGSIECSTLYTLIDISPFGTSLPAYSIFTVLVPLSSVETPNSAYLVTST